MSKDNKRPNIAEVARRAKRCGLFVMADGTGRDYHYVFWDEVTGKKVLTYYLSSKRWLSGDGQREGRAENYREALAVNRYPVTT